MKLLVLGATGPSGQLVVSTALDRGHEVIALVRSPDKLTIRNDKLKVVKGDVMSATDMTEQMTGCDAILSCLGGRPGLFTPCDVYSGATKAVVDGMKKTGVNRYVCLTAAGTQDRPNLPFIWRWILKPTLLRNVVNDMVLMEDFLESPECAQVNYTVVRPPRLLNTPSEGGKVQAVEGQLVPGAVNGLAREDLASFMLDCLATKEWDRKMVAVARPKK